MSNANAIQYERVVPDIFQAVQAAYKTIGNHGLSRGLLHLVYLRASQTNGCGHCVKFHLAEARQDGENGERLDYLVVWESASGFTDAERAALAWTDALTQLEPRTDYPALRATLRAHFSDEQIGALTAAVAMINLWNRINISKH